MENKISELIQENNELKLKITDIEKKERQRGVYQILADLNSAHKNIQKLQKELELKESEINLLKEKGTKDKNEIFIEVELNCNKLNFLNLLKEIEEKNALIGKLETENNSIKSELKELKELKDPISRRVNSNLNSNFIENIEKTKFFSNINNNNNFNNNIMLDILSPNLSFNNFNLNKNFPSDNFCFSENLKEDLAFLQNQSISRFEALKQENKQLAVQLINEKEDHKIELMRANLIMEELVKIMKYNSTNEQKNNNNNNDMIISNFKFIRSQIDNRTIEELKNEKIGFLDSITKLKAEVEAIKKVALINDNSNNINYKINLTNQENPEDALTLKSLNNEDYFNNNNYYKSNKNLIEFVEKDQNEKREKERKIEYLLQILSEKNNLIEKLQTQNTEKSQSLNSCSNETSKEIELFQNQINTLLAEIEEKNAKIKKQSKELNELTENHELLQADFLESLAKASEIEIHLEEIEMLKKKLTEFQQKIEALKKEINEQSMLLMRKENEISALKAQKANLLVNRSLQDSAQNLSVNASLLCKDPKIEILSNSLNEIKDLNEKLKLNNLNRSLRSERKENFFDDDKKKFNLNAVSASNEFPFPRVFFEEDFKNKNDNEERKSVEKFSHSFIRCSINSAPASADRKCEENKWKLGDYYAHNDNYNNSNALSAWFKKDNSQQELKKTNNIAIKNQALFVAAEGAHASDAIKRNSNLNIKIEDQSSDPFNDNNYSNINNQFRNSSLSYNFENTNNLKFNSFSSKYFSIKDYSSLKSTPKSTSTLDLQIITTTASATTTSSQLKSKINYSSFFQSSDIIKSEECWTLLRNWIQISLEKNKSKSFLPLNFTFKKIFKASENGFSLNSFNEKVEGKTPTLTIMKNNHGKILGGFTSIAWRPPSKSIEFLEDKSKTSFVFSLSLQKKYDLKENSIAVCHSVNSCAVFGLNDLEIVENADKNFNYFSNIGTSFYFEGASLEDFYGGQKYLVEDYEVYELAFF